MALCYKDRTFCGSPNCDNKCDRKISDEDKQKAILAGTPICYAYFCDIPDDPDDIWDTKKDE